MSVTVNVLNEIVHPGHKKDDWHLALQLAEFNHASGKVYKGYRFICRQGAGPTETQPRIPSLADAEILIQMAKKAGWGNEKG